MADLRAKPHPHRAPKKLGAWLALLGALGFCLAAGHGLHADDRPDGRSDLLHWTASDGRVADGPPDLCEGSLCSACRSRGDAKWLVVDTQGIAYARPDRGHRALTRSTVPRAHGRWRDAPAPPRAPPIA